MDRNEMTKFFDYMTEFFPRFHYSPVVVDLWVRKFKRHPAGLLRRAFERHLEHTDKAPSIFTIAGEVDTLVGHQAMSRNEVKETPTHYSIGRGELHPKTKMEIVLDALGEKFVTDAIAEIIGAPGTFKWADLVGKKKADGTPWDWITPYRVKVEELYQMARQYHNAPACVEELRVNREGWGQ